MDTLNGDLEMALMRKLYASAGASPASLKADFLVDWRDGFWVATNFTSTAQAIPARGNAAAAGDAECAAGRRGGVG